MEKQKQNEKGMEYVVEHNGIKTRCTAIFSGKIRVDVMPFFIAFVAGLVYIPVVYPVALVGNVLCFVLVYFQLPTLQSVTSKIVFLLSALMIVVCLIWATFTLFICIVLSMPYALVYLDQTRESLKLILMHCDFPRLRVEAINELMRCYAGLHHRHKLKCLYSIPNMLAFIPIYKLFLLNPFVRKLKRVHINQTSASLRSEPYQVLNIWRSLINDPRTRHCDFVDSLAFIGYYPTMNRYNSIGLQTTSRGSVIMMIWTENALQDEVKARSHRADMRLARVFLQSWNFFHFLIGYVEVNITSRREIEHPMWLIGDPSSYAWGHVLKSINLTFAMTFGDVISYMQ